MGVLDYGSIFVSSVPDDMKEDIQIIQNHTLQCCFNIANPRNANVQELHNIANVCTFKERLIRNLLLCIRNAVNEDTYLLGTLKSGQGGTMAEQLDFPSLEQNIYEGLLSTGVHLSGTHCR